MEPAPGVRPVRPWQAALASLLCPGLGHVWLGEPERGRRLFRWLYVPAIVWLSVVAIVAYLAPIRAMLVAIWLPTAAAYLFHGGIAVDAFRRARARTADAPAPRATTGACLRFAALRWAAILVATFLVRAWLMQAFAVPSGSMFPTLLVGDRFLVAKFAYGLRVPFTDVVLAGRVPRRGDVVVFAYPPDRSKDFVKRVVGLPGETVEIRAKRLTIDGKPVDDPHAYFADGEAKPDSAMSPRDDCGPYLVPPGEVFVLGDSRDRSYDSRFWGTVPLADVKGRAFFVYLSGWGAQLGRTLED